MSPQKYANIDREVPDNQPHNVRVVPDIEGRDVLVDENAEQFEPIDVDGVLGDEVILGAAEDPEICESCT